MNMPIFPPAMAPHASIHIVAPSGSFDKARFEKGIGCLQKAGFNPLYREDIFSQDSYLAGSDEGRLSALQAVLADPGVACIWAARGGYGATRLLAQMDVEALAKHPKWLVGFSDITALHCRWQEAGLISLHAANITTLADWSAEAREELFNLLRYQGDQAFRFTKVQGGEEVLHVPLRGGNLSVLSAMVGTGFLPDFSGACVFLEDVGEKAYRTDRCLTQLKQAGVFTGVKAIALGQFSDCGANEDLDFVVAKCLSALEVPILKDLPIGHDPSSRPLVLGAHYTIDLKERMMVLNLSRSDEA